MARAGKPRPKPSPRDLPDDASQIVPEAAESLANGNRLYKKGSFAEALAAYDIALTTAPRLHAALYNRAAALLALREPERALATIEDVLAQEPEDEGALHLRRAILDTFLWRMVDEGLASWAGGKPRGSKHPVKLTPGPPISDLIHEMRG